VLERTGEQKLPILFAPRYGGKTKLSVTFSRWGIETKNGEFVLFNPRFYGRGRDVIGKLQLERLEARCCGGIHPLKQRPVGEKIAKIGSEARHGLSLMISCDDLLRADARTYSLAPQQTQCHPEYPCQPIPPFISQSCPATALAGRSWHQPWRSCGGS